MQPIKNATQSTQQFSQTPIRNIKDFDASIHEMHRTLNSILGDQNVIRFEPRQAHFNKTTNIASGPITSIMVKITPSGNLKTEAAIFDQFLPALTQKLGSERFSRLVSPIDRNNRETFVAIDHSIYLKLDPEELLKLPLGAEFGHVNGPNPLAAKPAEQPVTFDGHDDI